MVCGEKEQLIFRGRVAVKHQVKQHSAAAAALAHNFCFTNLCWRGQKAKSGITSLALEEDVLQALLTASDCAFLALKRIHSFRGITSVWKLWPSTE